MLLSAFLPYSTQKEMKKKFYIDSIWNFFILQNIILFGMVASAAVIGRDRMSKGHRQNAQVLELTDNPFKEQGGSFHSSTTLVWR